MWGGEEGMCLSLCPPSPALRDAQEQRRAQIAARAQGLAFVRSAKCRWYIDALHLYGVQSLNVVFALAFFLLVGLKMDGYLGSLSWFVVFIPVYLIAAVLLAACWVSAQVVWRDEGDQPSVWTGQKMGDKGTMLGVLLDAFFDCFREMGSGDGFRNKFKWVVLGSVVLCAVLLPCVIPAKLDAPDSAAWAVWLLPLWILICCVNCCAIGAITMSDGVGGDTVLVWSILSCAVRIPESGRLYGKDPASSHSPQSPELCGPTIRSSPFRRCPSSFRLSPSMTRTRISPSSTLSSPSSSCSCASQGAIPSRTGRKGERVQEHTHSNLRLRPPSDSKRRAGSRAGSCASASSSSSPRAAMTLSSL